MKKIFLGMAICLALACSENKQQQVNQAIDQTGDSLTAKLDRLNDTLNKVKDRVESKIPKVEVNIGRQIPISLQWISFEQQGSAKISKQANGWFAIKGEQTNASHEFLKIDGRIQRLDKDRISFEGTIITYVKSNNGGVPCEKNGSQIFLKKDGRTYYRLQRMENCEGGRLVDYVDLYRLDEVL